MHEKTLFVQGIVMLSIFTDYSFGNINIDEAIFFGDVYVVIATPTPDKCSFEVSVLIQMLRNYQCVYDLRV